MTDTAQNRARADHLEFLMHDNLYRIMFLQALLVDQERMTKEEQRLVDKFGKSEYKYCRAWYRRRTAPEPINKAKFSQNTNKFDRDMQVRSYVIPKRGEVPKTVEEEEIFIPVIELASNPTIKLNELKKYRSITSGWD